MWIINKKIADKIYSILYNIFDNKINISFTQIHNNLGKDCE